MKDRIRELRKAMGLNQTQFGEKIGVKQSSVAAYESGFRVPLDTVILSMCRECGVREEWLRYGEGEMFKEKPRDEALSAGLEQVLTAGDEDFRKRMIAVLLELPSDKWKVLEEIAVKVVLRNSPQSPPTPHDLTEEEMHAELSRQLAGERESREKGTASSGSGLGSCGTG